MDLRLNVMFDDDDPRLPSAGDSTWRYSRDCLTAPVFSCVHRVRWSVLPSRVVRTFDTTLGQCLLSLDPLPFVILFFFQSCLPVWPSSRSQWPLSQHVLWRGFWGVAGLLLGRFWARVYREAEVRGLHECPHPGHGHSCLRSSRWASGADFGRRVASVSTVSSWRST